MLQSTFADITLNIIVSQFDLKSGVGRSTSQSASQQQRLSSVYAYLEQDGVSQGGLVWDTIDLIFMSLSRPLK